MLGSVPAMVLAGILVVAAVSGRRLAWFGVAFMLLGLVSGSVSSLRAAEAGNAVLPSGSVQATIRISEDATVASYGLAIGELQGLWGSPWDGPRVAVRSLPHEVTVGSTVDLVGVMAPGVRRVRDEIVAGVLEVGRITDVRASSNPLVTGGNLIRTSVRARYDGSHAADGLLAGFLTGDTDLMSVIDDENLRRAGLAHFVAVSGSNVALFLIIWWFVTAPLSIRPRLRVVVGFVGLVLFSVITRWEPSVIRASVMASVPLAGGWFGIPVDPWMALGTAVTLLILVSGDLVSSVGFQLSVAATAGVLVGIHTARHRRPKWVWVPLLTTVGAQVAVAPIILSVFGTIPLAAPLTNLIAGPIVAGSTLLATAGVLLPPFAWLARFGGTAVLWIARIASLGPQLGLASSLLAAAAVFLIVMRVTRPVAVAVLIVVAMSAPWSEPWPVVPTATVLDVGQGDAILIQVPDGSTLLMDGGSDPRTLDRALRRHGIRGVDIVIVSHNDIDHAGGLVELVASGRAGTLIVSRYGSAGMIEDVALDSRTPVVRVERGDRLMLGPVQVEVLSPHRRFASDNDGSVVVLVSAGLTILLPGDIESVGQRELPFVRPDILVVPHHGSRTTDLDWLASVVGPRAVLSYGPNRYGHPHPDVLAVLDAAGVTVRSTEDEGDITIPLAPTSR